ncbi:MAG: 50S ribosomal protein L7 [Oscillospiraceae bacterium]|jgi:ribosomal protein L7Ae-like RNA K-turn-binding protein|nr:50S ribosomal protein L7 [Oscillospiraceae bacterium]
MDKALNYLALARKAGCAELGEEPVGAMSRTGKAYLILVASDASDHTWRRAKSFAAGTAQQTLRVRFTKDEMGFAIGRTSLAIAAITDAALALALVQALGEPEKHKAVLESLSEKAAKLKKRKDEAKAHKKNVRMGKKK